MSNLNTNKNASFITDAFLSFAFFKKTKRR